MESITECEALKLHATARAQYASGCRWIAQGHKLHAQADTLSANGTATRCQANELRARSRVSPAPDLVLGEADKLRSRGCQARTDAAKLTQEVKECTMRGKKLKEQAADMMEQANTMLQVAYRQAAE